MAALPRVFARPNHHISFHYQETLLSAGLVSAKGLRAVKISVDSRV